VACSSQELTLGVGTKFFLIGWPILFVSAYGLVTLAVAGITVPEFADGALLSPISASSRPSLL